MLLLLLLSLVLLGGCDSDCLVGTPQDAGTKIGDGPTVADADGGALPGWALALSGEGEKELSRVVIDPAGDLILLGRYTGALTLEGLGGPIRLPASSAGRTFLAKLDPQTRKLRWARSLDGVPVRNRDGLLGYQDEGTDGLGVDAAGNIYVAGKFRRSASFGATTLTSAGDLDIFVVKLDPDGKVLWAVSAGGPGDDAAEDLALGEHGQLVVCGLFAATATFGRTTLGAAGPNDLFVAGLDPADGRFVWAARAGSDSTTVEREWAGGVALDPAGNSYIVGGVAGTARFGQLSMASGPGPTAYAAKLDPLGGFRQVWAPGARQLDAIALGRSVAHVAGGIAAFPKETFPFGDGVMVVIQGAMGGAWPSTFQQTAASTDKYIRARGVAADASGNTVVVGSFQGTATFGVQKLTTKVYATGFLARMSPAGEFIDARAMLPSGTFGVSRAAGLAVDRFGGIYVVGMFSDTVDLGGQKLRRQADSPGHDAFIWYTGRAED